jgi:hypothetical protein
VQRFVSMELQSFRVAQNCGATAFFASHKDTSTLTVFAWDESQAAPRPTDVGVARYIGGNGYQSRTPDGRRWLDRADDRITGATLAGNELWFAWGVNRGSNKRHEAFIQIARIDAASMTLVEDVNVFDPDSATCYAALATNANNEVGISYMIGGGPRFPTHVVGILTGSRKDAVVVVGDRGPLPDSRTKKSEWGDFLAVRRAYPNESLFAATGYTLKGKVDGGNLDATPRFVTFGRASDAGIWVPPPDGGDLPSASDNGPVKDVNALRPVSAAVGAKIKAMAGIGAIVVPLPPHALAALPLLVTKPGVERWPVKTGQDHDVADVGKNVIDGRDFGRGIVEATVEELISARRLIGMPEPTEDFGPEFQANRAGIVERTIWSVDATIIALKLEKDGDYHLVLQGESGETMIGEAPTPTTLFIDGSPWLANIKAARAEIDDRLRSAVPLAEFAPLDGMLVPRAALFVQPDTEGYVFPEETPLFKTRIQPVRARITGVGFFDRVHGQMGVSQSNGIEIHPILKVEWL